MSLKDIKNKLFHRNNDLQNMKKHEEDSPEQKVIIQAMQKIVNDLILAKERATPPAARLQQHDNTLKQLAWDKSANEASLKQSTENRKFYEVEEDEFKKHGEEIEKKIIAAEKAKSDFMLAKQIEKKPKAEIDDKNEANQLPTLLSQEAGDLFRRFGDDDSVEMTRLKAGWADLQTGLAFFHNRELIQKQKEEREEEDLVYPDDWGQEGDEDSDNEMGEINKITEALPTQGEGAMTPAQIENVRTVAIAAKKEKKEADKKQPAKSKSSSSNRPMVRLDKNNKNQKFATGAETAATKVPPTKKELELAIGPVAFQPPQVEGAD